jgi:hypothetical protein
MITNPVSKPRKKIVMQQDAFPSGVDPRSKPHNTTCLKKSELRKQLFCWQHQLVGQKQLVTQLILHRSAALVAHDFCAWTLT